MTNFNLALEKENGNVKHNWSNSFDNSNIRIKKFEPIKELIKEPKEEEPKKFNNDKSNFSEEILNNSTFKKILFI